VPPPNAARSASTTLDEAEISMLAAGRVDV
jgi:hypothetical protein